jgi:signal transduction histidine kinase
VTITAERDGEMIRLCVADDGPGVSPADAARLFEPFFTTRRAAGGTGLGLTIARSLLAAAGAEIALVTQERGTAFELRLPLTG